jgi:hypothetical protein
MYTTTQQYEKNLAQDIELLLKTEAIDMNKLATKDICKYSGGLGNYNEIKFYPKHIYNDKFDWPGHNSEFYSNLKRMINCISVYNVINPIFLKELLKNKTNDNLNYILPTWFTINYNNDDEKFDESVTESLQHYLQFLIKKAITDINNNYPNTQKANREPILVEMVQQLLIKSVDAVHVNYLFIKIKRVVKFFRDAPTTPYINDYTIKIWFIYDNQKEYDFYQKIETLYSSIDITVTVKETATNKYNINIELQKLIDVNKYEGVFQVCLTTKVSPIISMLFVINKLSNSENDTKNIDDIDKIDNIDKIDDIDKIIDEIIETNLKNTYKTEEIIKTDSKLKEKLNELKIHYKGLTIDDTKQECTITDNDDNQITLRYFKEILNLLIQSEDKKLPKAYVYNKMANAALTYYSGGDNTTIDANSKSSYIMMGGYSSDELKRVIASSTEAALSSAFSSTAALADTAYQAGNGLLSAAQKEVAKQFVLIEVLNQIIPKYHVLELLQDANFNEWYRFMIFVYHKIIKNKDNNIESSDDTYINYYKKQRLYPLDNNNKFEIDSDNNTLKVIMDTK